MNELARKPNERWPDDKVRECAAVFASNGSMLKTSKITGVNRTSLYDFKGRDVWLEVVDRVRQEKSDETLHSYQKIIDAGTKVVLEKLPESDARAAMTVVAIAQDKGRALMGLAQQYSGSGDASIADLARKFQALSADHARIQSSVVATQSKSESESKSE